VAARIAAVVYDFAERPVLKRTMSFITAPRRSRPRRWLFLVHLWTGLIVGPIVGVVNVTGAIVMFRYEINRMTTPGTAYVTPPHNGQRLSLDDLVARILAARPGDKLRTVGWEAGPDAAWNFRAQSPEGHRIHTFINPYTGDITGRDDYHDQWMQWFYDLHADLLAGDTGKFLNGFVGLATLTLGLTGLIVWWPGVSRWPFGFRYAWRTGWKRQNYDLHKVVGFYSSVAVMIVTLSGMTYSFPRLTNRATERLTRTTVTTDLPKAATRWGDRRVLMEQFIRAAEQAQPGAAAVQLNFPQQPGDPVTVRTKELHDWHRIGLNYVYLEPADARLLRSLRFSDANAGTRAILFMYPLHFGRFGGHWNAFTLYGVMVSYVLLGVAPFALMVTGFLMYWNRSFVKKVRRVRARIHAPVADLARGRANFPGARSS
jgi:uncharacterized iron-regulated membrane protein